MNLNPDKGIAVFTDGSAYTGDRSGGWAWAALDAYGGLTSESGGRQDVTISQMELLAPALALYAIYSSLGPCEVLVYSDSEYVVKGMQDKTRKRKVNGEWWEILEIAVALNTYVEFQHVKGHAGHEYNELVDGLAGKARKAVGASARQTVKPQKDK